MKEQSSSHVGKTGFTVSESSSSEDDDDGTFSLIINRLIVSEKYRNEAPFLKIFSFNENV